MNRQRRSAALAVLAAALTCTPMVYAQAPPAGRAGAGGTGIDSCGGGAG